MKDGDDITENDRTPIIFFVHLKIFHSVSRKDTLLRICVTWPPLLQRRLGNQVSLAGHTTVSGEVRFCQ